MSEATPGQVVIDTGVFGARLTLRTRALATLYEPLIEGRAALSRNGPLPSVKQLQEEYSVGRDTVLHAIEILRTEGLVFTVPRRGTYVSPDNK